MIDVPELTIKEVVEMSQIKEEAMGKRKTTPTANVTQASAACPKCGNIVWSDGLKYSDFFIDAGGAEKPGKLEINCATCGCVSVIRYQK